MHERERWQLILTRLRERGIVRVGDLVALTGASLATLRRDLAKLEDSGQLRRVHGGAEHGRGFRPERDLTATSFGASQTLNAGKKRAYFGPQGRHPARRRRFHHSQRRFHDLVHGAMSA